MRHKHDPRLGWTPDAPDPRDLLLLMASTAPVAPSVDLEPVMPPVYDQGQLGSCTGNGVAATLDTARKKQGLEFMTPSRLSIYWWERHIEGTVDSDSGGQIRDGIKVVAKYGAPPESEWPYDIAAFKKKPPAAVMRDAVAHEALLYKRVPQTQRAIMQALSAGMAIVFGFTVYESFMSDEVTRTGIVPMPEKGETIDGGHCTVINGYNTTDFPSLPKIRNSWSADWGIRGHFALPWPYLLNPRLASDFWAIESVTG